MGGSAERLSRPAGLQRHAVDCTMKARVWQTVQTMGFPVACTVEAVAYFEDQDLFPELFCFRKEEDGHISMTTLMLGAQDKMCGFSVADLGAPRRSHRAAYSCACMLQLAPCRPLCIMHCQGPRQYAPVLAICSVSPSPLTWHPGIE